MSASTDLELVKGYAEARSEAAFEELVARHVDLVYVTARRLLNGDDHLARDVAQSVFTDLARKASALAGKSSDAAVNSFSVVGWLYTSTRFAACKAVRAEETRRKHEREAQAMSDVLHGENQEPDWAELRPAIEELLGTLAEAERDAVLLRFFEGKDFRTVGMALGLGEDAARKRVTRALDKMRDLLAARGLTTTATALSVALTAHAFEAAPTGLAASISTAALATSGAVGAGSLSAWMAAKVMASLKLKIGLAGALVAALSTPIVLLDRSNRNMQVQHRHFEQEIQRLKAELASRPVPEPVAVDAAEHMELLRLRGQVGRLRVELAEKEARAKEGPRRTRFSESQTANMAEPEDWRGGKFLPKEKISNLGIEDPEAAVQTYLWALLQEDAAVARDLVCTNSSLDVGMMRDEFADRLGTAAGVHFDGYSANSTNFTALVSVQNADDTELSKRIRLEFQDGKWRVVEDQWTPRKVLFGPKGMDQQEGAGPSP